MAPDLILIRLLALVFALVVHEFAHGWMALKMGDPTARDAGRLTLNPLPHIDPIGSIAVPLVLSMMGGMMFGWAKPVPVNFARLNSPWNDQPKIAAAGPAVNLILALLFSIVLGIVAGVVSMGDNPTVIDRSQPSATLFILQLARECISINIVLALFNLIPVPPLDGSWILRRFLPYKARVFYDNLARFGSLLLIGLVVLLRYTFLGSVLGMIFGAIASVYMGVTFFVAGLF